MLNQENILIVEDNIASQQALKELLELHDIAVDTCCTGEDAVKMAANKDYHVIIMDIGLPGIDGIEATKRIKQHKPKQIVVAHSGHENAPGDLFDGNYPKPTLSMDIETFIDEFL